MHIRADLFFQFSVATSFLYIFIQLWFHDSVLKVLQLKKKELCK